MFLLDFFLKKVYSLGMGSNGSGDALYVVLFLSLRLWFIFFVFFSFDIVVGFAFPF